MENLSRRPSGSDNAGKKLVRTGYTPDGITPGPGIQGQSPNAIGQLRQSDILLVDLIVKNGLVDSVQLKWLVHKSAQRRSCSARWRSWVASYALVALAWPSLGLLPWIAVDSAPHHHSVAYQEAESDADHSSASQHEHGDASHIPGSPTHPADHDCFQCQVLKHLSRCVVPQIVPPTIPLPSGCPVQPRVYLESQHAGRIAFLPPVRGPPLQIA